MPYAYPLNDQPVAYGEYYVANTYYPPYGYYYPPYQPYRLGWVCPRCNKVFNPDVQQCWTCGQNNATVTWSNTLNTNTETLDNTIQVNDVEGRDGG